MTVPISHDMMKPILEVFARDENALTRRNVINRMKEHYALTQEDLAEKTSSGKARFDTNVNFAITDLKYGGCLEVAGTADRDRKFYRITRAGLEAIVNNPETDNLNKYLIETSASYREYKKSNRKYPDRSEPDMGAQTGSVDASVRQFEETLLRERNLILYGAPGTGKSHAARLLYAGHEHLVTTFHPDYDYTDFVGSYKPRVNPEGKITYAFTPQVFTRAYCRAWKLYCDALQDADPSDDNPCAEPMYLTVEEINRGNCAQAFGDIFQLLDRSTDGFSRYAIACDYDLATWMEHEFENCPEYSRTIMQRERSGDAFDYSCLMLPPNLYLLATMNTSDQSLFPMDSAFRRRWSWEYVAIDYDAASGVTISLDDSRYSWGDFLTRINEKISRLTLSEDKQLGPYFVRIPSDGIITEGVFRSKVLFYLWHDVFRDESDGAGNLFRYAGDGRESRQVTFSELHGAEGHAIMRHMLEQVLGLKAIPQ